MRLRSIGNGLETFATKHPPRVAPLDLQVRIATLRPRRIGLRLRVQGEAPGDQQQRQALVDVLAAQTTPLTLAECRSIS